MISPQMIQVAIELINAYGSTVTLQSVTSSYNTTTGSIEETVDTSDPIKATIDSYSSQEVQGLVNAGDIKMTIANNNLDIQMNTKILFGGYEYNIINIQPLYLEDAIVIYDIQVRK